MQEIIQHLLNKLNQLDKVEDTGKLILEIQKDFSMLSMEADVLNFKLQRALKDKYVINSLLTRTSEDLKRALQEKEHQAERLNILLNTIPALVYFKDSNLHYQIVNKAFLDFFGLDRKEIIGKTSNEVYHHYLIEGEYLKLEKKVIKEGSVFYNVEEIIRKNEKKIWVHTNIAPVRDKNSVIIGLIGISWDISSQKNYEMQLRHARDMAEEGMRIKDQFLTNMSHEIRTPINGIVGMAEILNQTPLEKKQQEYLSNLMNSAKHLMDLIEDVFEFSAIESGKYRPIRELFSICFQIKPYRNFLLVIRVRCVSFCGIY